MKLLILIILLSYITHSAIIGSTIYTLSRQFQYQINITSNNQNILEYATLTPSNECQKNGFCFYGWINNFTIGTQSNDGFKSEQLTNNPIFYIQFFTNSSFSVIRNNALQAKELLLLDITAQLISPLFASANLTKPFYQFIPYNNSASSKLSQISLDLQDKTFAGIVQNIQTTSNYVGWNKNNPQSDVILYNKGLNCLMGRQIDIPQSQIKVEIELVSKSIFAGFNAQSDIIVQLKNNAQNIVNGIIDEDTIFPKEQINRLFL